MTELLAQDHRYAEAYKERQKHVDSVVHSGAYKKLVVAGPGTGKTHIFKTVLAVVIGDGLHLML
jgi:hypothetical protein